MNITRFINVKGVLLDDKTVIPIWDDRIKFNKTEDYGENVEVDGELNEKFNLVDCVFDLKKKTISRGIELNIHPNLDKLEFKKGDNILFATHGKRKLDKTKIKDIIFEEFDISIVKGSKIEKYYLNSLPSDFIIEHNSIYCIRVD